MRENIGGFTGERSAAVMTITQRKASAGYPLAWLVLVLVVPVFNVIHYRSYPAGKVLAVRDGSLTAGGLVQINFAVAVCVLLIYLGIGYAQRRAAQELTVVLDRSSNQVSVNGRLVNSLTNLRSVSLERQSVRNDSFQMSDSLVFWTLLLHFQEVGDVGIALGTGEYSDMKRLDMLMSEFAGADSDLSP